MLASDWGQTGPMTDIVNGVPSIVIKPVEKESTLELNLYASEDPSTKGKKLIEDQSFAKGGMKLVRVSLLATMPYTARPHIFTDGSSRWRIHV